MDLQVHQQQPEEQPEAALGCPLPATQSSVLLKTVCLLAEYWDVLALGWLGWQAAPMMD